MRNTPAPRGNRFQLPLSGSLETKWPVPLGRRTFNSLSRDHGISVGGSRAHGYQAYFQLPLSGSRVLNELIAPMIDGTLSTPSLGITGLFHSYGISSGEISELSTPSLGITEFLADEDAFLPISLLLSTPSLGITF